MNKENDAVEIINVCEKFEDDIRRLLRGCCPGLSIYVLDELTKLISIRHVEDMHYLLNWINRNAGTEMLKIVDSRE